MLKQPGAAGSLAAGAATVDGFTQQAIRALLDGEDAASYAALPLAAYGAWSDTMQLLLRAHDVDGVQGVQAVYRTLLRNNQALHLLMCAEPPQRRRWKMRQLLRAESKPTEFVIPGFVPTGLSTLAGRPKIGKSWLVLQMLVAADTGGEFLGRRVPKTKVCYLALEDTENRLIDRLKKSTAGLEIDLDEDGEAVFETSCPTLAENGLAELRDILEEGFKLVFIDTFSRILGRGDQMDTQEMTRIMAALQRLALDHHAAILVVDHHRKSARTSLDADPIDDILGSTAKAGVVDCALGLYRRHNEGEASLKLSGRDFGDEDLALEWDPTTFRWNLKETKAAAKSHFTLREQEIIDAVSELGQPTLAQLVAHTGQNKSNLYNRLQNLCRRGALASIQGARGCQYTLTGHPAHPAAPVVEVADVVDVVGVVDVAPTAASAPEYLQPTTGLAGRTP